MNAVGREILKNALACAFMLGVAAIGWLGRYVVHWLTTQSEESKKVDDVARAAISSRPVQNARERPPVSFGKNKLYAYFPDDGSITEFNLTKCSRDAFLEKAQEFVVQKHLSIQLTDDEFSNSKTISEKAVVVITDILYF